MNVWWEQRPLPLLVWTAVLTAVCHVLKHNFEILENLSKPLLALICQVATLSSGPPFQSTRFSYWEAGEQRSETNKVTFLWWSASKKQDLNKIASDKWAREELLGPGSKNLMTENIFPFFN